VYLNGNARAVQSIGTRTIYMKMMPSDAAYLAAGAFTAIGGLAASWF